MAHERALPRPTCRAVVPGAVAALLLAGCTSGTATDPDRSRQAPPPDPPAACLLDTAALAAATGVTWTPDQSIATDTRCVYDPTGEAGARFLAVDIAPTSGDVAGALDTVAEVCEAGSRAPVSDDDTGFVCRFQGGSVYGATVRDSKLVTVAAAAVPTGTTAARLVVALTRQIAMLRS